MNRSAFVLAAAGAAVAAPGAVRSETFTAMDAIARLFTAAKIEAAWFEPLFVAQYPPEQTKRIVDNIVGAVGPYRSIAPNGNGYTLTFARGTVQAQGKLNADGAFAALLFSRMQCDAASARLKELFTADTIQAAWFDERFLAEIPVDRSRALVGVIKQQNGTLGTVAPDANGTYDLTFSRGTLSALIFLDADSKIAGLIFRPRAAA